MLSFSAAMMLITGGEGLPSGAIITSGARFSTFALKYSRSASAYWFDIVFGSNLPDWASISWVASLTAS